MFKTILCCFILQSILFFKTSRSVILPSCTTIPISVSDINYCEDNICAIKQTANIALQLFDNSNSCLDFISPDGVSKSASLLFHVQRAHYVWEAESFYYTDSPSIDIRGHCGCPGGSSGTCSSCHGNRVSGDVQFCLSGTHNSADCVLDWFGGSGTWCTKIGLTGNNRYKVIKLRQSYNVEILLEIVLDDRIITLEYDGSTKFYKNDSFPFEFTLVSDTSKPHFSPYFVVYDKNDQSDFYLLDSTEVNDINEYSNSKFGWYKSNLNAKVSATLGNEIQSRVANCNRNTFNVQYPWIYPDAFLKARTNKLSHNSNADSFLIDNEYQPDYSSYKNIPNHEIIPYHYIADGWMLVGTYSAVEFIGKTKNGISVPPMVSYALSTFIGMQITTNFGTMILNSSFTMNQVAVMTKEASTFYAAIYMFELPQTGIYGFCMNYNAGVLNCLNPTLNVYSWPNFDYVTILFDGSCRKTVIENSGNNLDKVQFIDEITKGVVNINVVFKNFTIKFDNTIIKPRINYIRVNLNEIVVNAQSATVGGSCYISSEPPDVIQAQPILLTVNPIDFKYTSFTNIYLGNFTTIIRCYKNTDRMSAAIYINGTITNVGFQNATINQEGNSAGNLNFLNYLGDFKDFFNSNEPWYYSMFKILIIILASLLLLILIYYITKIFLISCLKSCINRCKWNKNKQYLKNETKLAIVRRKIE